MVEEKADGVPSYTIVSLNDPQRIIIELPEVEHWDYEFNTPVYENKGVFGLFKVPMEKDTLFTFSFQANLNSQLNQSNHMTTILRSA